MSLQRATIERENITSNVWNIDEFNTNTCVKYTKTLENIIMEGEILHKKTVDCKRNL